MDKNKLQEAVKRLVDETPELYYVGVIFDKGLVEFYDPKKRNNIIHSLQGAVNEHKEKLYDEVLGH